MISYNASVKKYIFKPEYLNKVIKLIDNIDYYTYFSKEDVEHILNNINDFLNGISVETNEATLLRHETEDEAREYFGNDFINELNNLLISLDNEQTIAYFHGTNVNVCRLINETGLLYKSPSLNMTSVGQDMPFGQGDYCYSDFEGLLNWKHKEHKGLAIIAVPYESFYKTGLWSTFKESAYGFSYKINPEFIVGYIDVVNKKIVRNPQYKREHNYADLIPDMSIYRKQEGIDNIDFLNSMVDVDMSFNGELSDSSNINENNIFDDVDLKVDTDQIVSVIDNFKMCFNSIALLESNEMSEERYKDLLNKISDGVSYISNILPLLESEEQKKDDSSTAFSMFK